MSEPPDSERRLAPITVRVATAARITSLSRSRIYELIQSGDIETVKVGRAMLLKYRSVMALLGENAADVDPYLPTPRR
jgi:excisionase family DNA binding protein